MVLEMALQHQEVSSGHDSAHQAGSDQGARGRQPQALKAKLGPFNRPQVTPTAQSLRP